VRFCFALVALWSFVWTRSFVCGLFERAVGLFSAPLPAAAALCGASQLPPARSTRPPRARRAGRESVNEGASMSVGSAPRDAETGTRDALSAGRSRRGPAHGCSATPLSCRSKRKRTQARRDTHACMRTLCARHVSSVARALAVGVAPSPSPSVSSSLPSCSPALCCPALAVRPLAQPTPCATAEKGSAHEAHTRHT
jgi:hypothetical protein